MTMPLGSRSSSTKLLRFANFFDRNDSSAPALKDERRSRELQNGVRVRVQEVTKVARAQADANETMTALRKRKFPKRKKGEVFMQ